MSLKDLIYANEDICYDTPLLIINNREEKRAMLVEEILKCDEIASSTVISFKRSTIFIQKVGK